MRIRIIIDTEVANDPAAIETNTPFTLNVYRDDDDGTPSRQPLELGTETASIGNDIAVMLENLSALWSTGNVLGQDGTPLPRLWAGQTDPDAPVCDECDQLATRFWPNLKKPVQLCEGCAHDAFRSGWEPGA